MSSHLTTLSGWLLSLEQAVLVLRLDVAAVLLSYAVMRLPNRTILCFSTFLQEHAIVKLPAGSGVPFVYLLTAIEVIGGILLAFGVGLLLVPLAFMVQMIGGIALLHVKNGWFTGEHGSGGVEYPSMLILALLVIAAST